MRSLLLEDDREIMHSVPGVSCGGDLRQWGLPEGQLEARAQSERACPTRVPASPLPGCRNPPGRRVRCSFADILICRGQGLSAVLGAEPHRMSVSFGRTTQNSFPSGSARTVQDSAPVWPVSARRAPSVRRRSISWSRSAALVVRSRSTRFLTVLAIGDRHEADADRRALVGPDDDLVLPLGQDLPAQRLRPEPGQGGQIVSVDDDVVESDGHAASMRDTVDRIPGTRCSAADGVDHRRSRDVIAPRSCDQT